MKHLTEERLDKIRGCMIGGAVGDALGYAIEFDDIQSVRKRYGQQGITRYLLNYDGVAEISDDTQMSLFTAVGLLNSFTRHSMCSDTGKAIHDIAWAYCDWYETQTGEKKPHRKCWIRDIPELNHRRAPGITCLSALQCLREGRDVQNNSKGCGGVMRVAPIALYPYPDRDGSAQDACEIARLGAEAAEITHQHPLGIYPAAMLVHLIYRIVNHPVDSAVLEDIIEEALTMNEPQNYTEATAYMKDLVHQAIQLSKEDMDDVAAISKLGEGWTGEEAYAIAVYCVLKYRNDFEKAIVAAVNHSGDSDSTGAIAGNIMGALSGRKAIPDYYIKNLELVSVIEEIAHDLYTGCIITNNAPADTPEKELWRKKYGENK